MAALLADNRRRAIGGDGMTDNERVGLTLGKYAPLHQGHQMVIETALAEMDHVIVVIYDCPIDAAYSCPHLIPLAYRFQSSEKVCGGFIGVMLHPRCTSSVKM